MNILNKKNDNKNWTSKTKLMIDLGINLGITSDIIEQIIYDFSIRWPSQFKVSIKKGGFHNLETYYDDFQVTVITELAKHNTNQNTDIIQKEKEQGILLNAIINSGNLKAAQDLCDSIMERTKIQAENKRMSEQDKQIEKEIKILTDLLYNCKS